MGERELRHFLHSGFQLWAGGKCQRQLGSGEQMRGGQLSVKAFQRGPCRFAHQSACCFSGFAVALHGFQGFKPCAGQRFAQLWMLFQRGGIDHQQVEDLAGDFR